MANEDPVEAMKAWTLAKGALAQSEEELTAARAGHEVAVRCEREAWDKIAKLCGHEPTKSPPQAPPVVPAYGETVRYPLPPVTLGTFVQQQPHYYSYAPSTRVAGMSGSGW